MKIYKGKKRHCHVYLTPVLVYQKYRCDGKPTHCIGIAIGHHEYFIEFEL